MPAQALSFAEELAATFLTELDERLRSMEVALVTIERPPDESALRTALETFARDAHSLKGGAQLVGNDGLARIAHALETRLERLHGGDPGDRMEVEPLFAAIDALDRLRQMGHDGDVDVAGLVAQLTGEPAADPSEVDRATAPGTEGATDGTAPPAAIAPPPEPILAAAPTARPPESRETPRRRAPGARRAPRAEASAAAVNPPRSVRVSTERLDALMNRTADLIAARDAAARRADALREAVRKVGPDGAAVEPAELARQLRSAAREARLESQRLAALVEALEADLLGLRMVPLATLFRDFPRMVRDLARAAGKDVRLEAIGWTTPLDRDLIERLRDPVMHLLRNAVDHGIETAAVRLARGKPAFGTIILEARPRAGGITIEVRDDGGGIDVDLVRERAEDAGLVDLEAPRSTALSLGLIFESGFSTARDVTEISGRGVGLDVVRAQVAAVGGAVEVESERGLGARFVLRLPLTLVSTTVLVVRTTNQRYAVPLVSVERALPLSADGITALGDRTALAMPGGSIVLADLGAIMGGPGQIRGPLPEAGAASSMTVLVLASASGRAGIVVEAVEAERQVVLKGFGPILGTPELLAGAALVDGDALLLVLDSDAVVERALAGGAAWSPTILDQHPARDEPSRTHAADRPVRVLVVDDSITTRTLEKNILSAAGFEVVVAIDGLQALRAIRAETPDIVISDVDMPGLDGIGLTRQLRANEATRHLPVILVTSLDSPEQRDQGLEAGADAYLTKQAFDQGHLLRSIRELVG